MLDETIILQEFFPYQLTNLAQRVSSTLAKTYQQQFNLSIAQWRVLACLGEHQRATAKIIADNSFMDKVKTSRAIKELDTKGLITKTQDKQDSRAYWLSLNNKGKKLYQQVAPHALSWEKDLLSSLRADEYQALMKIIIKLNQKLADFN